MKKKIYQRPSSTVVEVNMDQTILSDSGTQNAAPQPTITQWQNPTTTQPQTDLVWGSESEDE
jgi:hypothetical protein